MEHLFTALKGIALGMAFVIPGFSGGTMAVILKIYDKLLDAISLNLKKLKKNLPFIIALGLGMAVGVFLAAVVLSWLFDNHPVPTKLTLIGIVLGSLPVIWKECISEHKFKKINLIPFTIAFAIMIAMFFLKNSNITESEKSSESNNTTIVSEISDTTEENSEGSQNENDINTAVSEVTGTTEENSESSQNENDINTAVSEVTGTTEENSEGNDDKNDVPKEKIKFSVGLALKLAVGGMIAAISMVVPGISGSLMLAIMGIYETTLSAVSDRNFALIIPIGAGAVAGVLVGAKIISILLKKFKQGTYAIIIGLIVGSLLTIFPKDFRFNIEGMTGIILGIIGFILPIAFDRFESKNKTQ